MVNLDLTLLRETLGSLVLESLLLRGELSQCRKSLELLKSEAELLRSQLPRHEGEDVGAATPDPLEHPSPGV